MSISLEERLRIFEEMREKYMNTPRKTFANQEEWHEWVNAMAGSIPDETFVRPVDRYTINGEVVQIER